MRLATLQERRAADLFWRDLTGGATAPGRRAFARASEDHAEVADPVADKRLYQVLLGALQSDQTRAAGAAAFFFQIAPPKHSDPSVSQARGSSPIDCMIKTVVALRATLSRVVPGRTPGGEVKLALSDDPDAAALDLLGVTALDYRWNVEVLVPVLPSGARGRGAVSRAIAAGRLADVRLVSARTIAFSSITAPSLGPRPCRRLPADQIAWPSLMSGGGLHIDAGGDGAHADAANFNRDPIGWGTRSGVPVPNLVCGNIMRTWPIGDRMADKITVEGSPIHSPEIARVIKSPGRISILTPSEWLKKNPDILPTLRRQLGTRLGREVQTDEGASKRIVIDVR
jgi:hypothetical protein